MATRTPADTARLLRAQAALGSRNAKLLRQLAVYWEAKAKRSKRGV